MFKKPINLGQGNALSGGDRKKLKKTICKSFGIETSTGEEPCPPESPEGKLDAMVPNKHGVFSICKVASPSKMLIYTLEGTPLFFDLSGKGDILPTVYALWQLPSLLPTLSLKHHAATKYLLGGADLMLPGVFVPPEGLPPFVRGQLFSVTVRGNPCPLAVGRTLLSTTDISRMGPNPRGKLLEVLHVFGDHLWSLPATPFTPNDGFFANCVVPLGQLPGGPQSEGSEGEGGEGFADPWTEGESPAPAPTAAAPASSPPPPARGEAPAMPRTPPPQQPESDSDEGSADVGPSMTPEECDELLKFCVLQALHTSVGDDQLPQPCSAFWSTLLQCRPPATTLDIKKSSYKKLSKLISHYAAEGLWTAKEDKRTKELVLTSVNRKLPLYATFKPAKVRAPPPRPEPTSSDVEAGPSGRPAPLVIQELYRAHPNSQAIFKAVRRDLTELYTAAQVAEIAFEYVKCLEDNRATPAADPRSIELDMYLTDALYKGVLRKEDAVPTHVTKAALRTLFVERQLPNWTVSRGAQRLVRKGPSRPIQVGFEKRMNNKVVTKVVGVEDFLIDPEQLAEELKVLVAGSTTIEEPPPGKSGPAKHKEIFAQGAHQDKVAAYLQKHYGVPAKCVEVKKDPAAAKKKK